MIQLGGKRSGLRDLITFFCWIEGLPLFLQLALRRILGTFSQGVEDVYAELGFTLLCKTLKARARPMPFQQLKTQLLEGDLGLEG